VTDIVAFGSPCTVYANPKKTLDRRGTAGIIVGKNEETKGYKVIVVKDNVVVTTRHVGNIETLSSEANEQLQAVLEREAENDLEALASRRQEERNARETSSQNLTAGRPTTGKSIRANAKQKKSVKGIGGELRRSGRQRKKSQRQREADGDSVQHASDKLDNAGTKVVMSALKHVLVMSAIGAGEEQYRHLPDPKSYRAAMQMPDAHLWQMAFDEEVNSLEANKTWEPQVLGRDYEMTFSAVLDLTSGKIILAVAHIWKVRAKHYDVPNAYVRAFKEPQFQIYMRIPEGMKLSREQLRRLGVSDQIRVCLRLVKSLYGLKQAGRLWNRLLHETLTNDAGMIQSATDACVYYNITSRGTTLVGVYVDDLLATATSEELLTEFEHNMKSMELKVGLAENFLGMRISYDEQTGYAVDAEHTIVDLLGKFGLQKANAVRVPIADESTLEAEAGNDELLPEHGSGTPERPTRQMFQSLVGSLLWLVRTTRPDAMYAVHRATRRSHAPTLQDWKMAKRIMRYLAGTASLKLHLGSGINTKDVVVSAYTDADYAADKQSRKSVSGSVILVNGMTVGWLVKQQTSVALSTAEAEFVAAAVGVREALGIRNLLEEIGMAKHVDVKLKFVRDESSRGIVKPEYVDTKAQLADIFTKSLAAPRMAELREMLGLK
ncbi:mitochondrial protein, partial [Phytophthora palmivora]